MVWTCDFLLMGLLRILVLLCGLQTFVFGPCWRQKLGGDEEGHEQHVARSQWVSPILLVKGGQGPSVGSWHSLPYNLTHLRIFFGKFRKEFSVESKSPWFGLIWGVVTTSGAFIAISLRGRLWLMMLTSLPMKRQECWDRLWHDSFARSWLDCYGRSWPWDQELPRTIAQRLAMFEALHDSNSMIMWLWLLQWYMVCKDWIEIGEQKKDEKGPWRFTDAKEADCFVSNPPSLFFIEAWSVCVNSPRPWWSALRKDTHGHPLMDPWRSRWYSNDSWLKQTRLSNCAGLQNWRLRWGRFSAAVRGV